MQRNTARECPPPHGDGRQGPTGGHVPETGAGWCPRARHGQPVLPTRVQPQQSTIGTGNQERPQLCLDGRQTPSRMRLGIQANEPDEVTDGAKSGGVTEGSDR